MEYRFYRKKDLQAFFKSFVIGREIRKRVEEACICYADACSANEFNF